MNLSQRLAKGTDRAAGPAVVTPSPAPRQVETHGLYTFWADFYTEHRTVQATLTSPEFRLSDHLNSSTVAVDVLPSSVSQPVSGAVNLDGSFGHLTKARVLFAVPLSEPSRPRGVGNAAWKPTVRRSCWAGVGTYRIAGTIHTEAGRDLHIALRLLDKQFMPLTDVKVSFPDGTVREFPTIIINRHHLDLLSIGE